MTDFYDRDAVNDSLIEGTVECPNCERRTLEEQEHCNYCGVHLADFRIGWNEGLNRFRENMTYLSRYGRFNVKEVDAMITEMIWKEIDNGE